MYELKVAFAIVAGYPRRFRDSGCRRRCQAEHEKQREQEFNSLECGGPAPLWPEMTERRLLRSGLSNP